MLSYPQIDPVIIHLGPLAVRWYGLMYILGFIAAYIFIQRQKPARAIGLQGAVLQDLFVYLILGLVVGARLGYVVFYQYAAWLYYIQNPLAIIAVWEGGMSFHGGMLGVVAAIWYFSFRRNLPFWCVADSVAVVAPIGLGLGRIGNFINAELYGRVTSMPWGMVFPEGGSLPRHPSQLYQAFFEGLLLFVILWILRKRDLPDGRVGAAFVFLYGLLRFFTEFFREPDSHIGLLANFLSMGQILCIGMMLAGILLWYCRRTDASCNR